MAKSETKGRDKVLSEQEEISVKLFVLENQVTQMRLVDARAQLAAIDLVSYLRASTLTYDESVAFVENETSNAGVLELAKTYLNVSKATLDNVRTKVEQIIKGLA